MSDKQIQIVIPEKRFVGANPTDQNEKVFLEGNQEEFLEGDRNILVDLAEQFNTERQSSEKYRIYGKITPLFVNAYSGSTTYSPLLNSLYLTSSPLITGQQNYAGYPPYNEFAFIRNDVNREIVNKDNTITEVVGNKHIQIHPYNAHEYNWNTYLSYVFDKDVNRSMTYTKEDGSSITFKVSDGLPVDLTFDTTQRLCVCQCPVEHGLSDTDYILMNDILYKIDSLGNDVYDSEKFIFNIQLLSISGKTHPGLHVFKRVLDASNIEESTSSYYIQKHKIISSLNDFAIGKCGFEGTIFEDEVKLEFENPDKSKDVYKEKERGEVLLYHYKKVFERLKYSNSDIPVNEVYITILNRNGMGLFNPLKVGWSFNLHDTYSDYYFSGSTSVETGITTSGQTISGLTFNVGLPLSSGSTLTGAMVEYNKYELKERVISDALHRLSFDVNHFDHEQYKSFVYPNSSNDNMFGYFYQPHHKITLKEYSSYIEESETNNIDNFPGNAVYFTKDKVWRWREILDHGFVDDNGVGVDYPFLNDTHYIKKDIRFYIRSEYHFTKKDKVVLPHLNSRKNVC